MDDAYDDIVDDFLAELMVVKVKLVYLVVLRRSNKKKKFKQFVLYITIIIQCKTIFLSRQLQLEILQRQVTNLADSQNTVDDRTSRTKTEHAVLQARYHMLEEQLRDVRPTNFAFGEI